MAASLSSHDVARLMSEPSPDVRAELAGKIAADLSHHTLTPTEVRLGQDIVRILARDVEERVRASLSEGLRHSPNLPRDVARRLAEDVEICCVSNADGFSGVDRRGPDRAPPQRIVLEARSHRQPAKLD